MNHDGTKWDIYDDFLLKKKHFNRNQNIDYAQSSLYNLAQNDASYQEDAMVNGKNQPLLALRESDNICKVTLMPNDEMFAGDIVSCYGENWIVIDIYTDEYGITTGTMWLCNHLLKFQNYSSDILETYCVIDDGSYSKLTQKTITTTEAQYTMYLPLNEDTEKIYIDKRFAIGEMYNKQGQIVLQVMQTTWIDKVYQNGGNGNHLLKIRLQSDVYDANKDSIQHMICDYIDKDNEILEEQINDSQYKITEDSSSININENATLENNNSNTVYSINGKNTIRIGTSRTYTLICETMLNNIVWKTNLSSIKLDSDNNICRMSIPLDESILGREITLEAYCENIKLCSKVIKVVAIG